MWQDASRISKSRIIAGTPVYLPPEVNQDYFAEEQLLYRRTASRFTKMCYRALSTSRPRSTTSTVRTTVQTTVQTTARGDSTLQTTLQATLQTTLQTTLQPVVTLFTPRKASPLLTIQISLCVTPMPGPPNMRGSTTTLQKYAALPRSYSRRIDFLITQL